ncbi:hypothetical protein F7725_016498 [Dissostichus mawsoni]|uniref:Kelch domain containing 8A n=1 Tax=Dissostichus mawsoni TaxID=36200 RepID=A0A7J5Z1S9_DISMA|nr:hypothetical protein F7725_016498 [Dissostichus mawsoni]
MYMLGGCDAVGRPSPALELYSPEGDRWMTLPQMPTPRAGAAVAVLGKQILVVGGVGEDQSPLKVVEMFNTEEGKWRKRSTLREALMGVSITVKDGRALAVGGMGADLLPRSILQQYDLRKDCKRPVKAFEVFDAETRSWTTLPSMPCKRSYGGVLWDVNGRLCLLGGLRQGGHQSSKFTKNVNIFDTNQGHEPSALDTVEAFHPQKKKWERLSPMSSPRCSTSSIVIRDRLLVVGGVNQTSQVRAATFDL